MATPLSGKTGKRDLDEEQIEKLASIGCTLSEMAAFFNCSIDTISRFTEALQKGREHGKASVRRMMWKHGEAGNSTALKYLVTNILKEKIENLEQKIEFSHQDAISEKLRDVSNSALINIIKAARKESSNE